MKPEEIRKVFKVILSTVQRGKGLESFQFIDDSYLISIDGTGYFSSKDIHCDQCCEKNIAMDPPR
ncbi:MAG: hypothetical protein Q9M28_06825, partial [Mariprofundaceae bacterium]|nr:hypothetical protein [Mariprofundaceae bacterium]